MTASAAVEQEKDQAGSEVAIRHLEAGIAEDWDRYVTSSPDGTFYHLSTWNRIIGKVLGHETFYIYAERGGSISGVLPLARVSSLFFGDALISTPFLVYGGPVATDEESRSALIAESARIGRDLGVDYVELRNRSEMCGEGWATKRGSVTFRKRISSSADENLKAIPRKQRAMIRKGMQAGLKAEIDDDVDRLDDALLVCKRNLGTPFFGRSWLAAIKDAFGDAAEILTVTHGANTVCSVMSFRFRDEIMPYYGGGGDLARKFMGNDFMYWAVMEKACQEGVEVFDYGRSREGSGAYRFKKHWGFEPTPLAYEVHLVRAERVPNLNPSNPKYRFFVDAWKKLPLPVARAIGPVLARRLG